MGAAILALYNEVAAGAGGQTLSGPTLNKDKGSKFNKIAKKLLANRGKSLVVSGTNNIGEQVLVNAINNLLGNYGQTLYFTNASLARQGMDKNIQGLLREMNAGNVDALFFMDGANPAFDIPNAAQFGEAMAKVGMKVSFSGLPSETTDLCDFTAPSNHFLESWGDAEPKRGAFSLIQPTIAPLFDTRQVEESLARWAESESFDLEAELPVYEYLKAYWETEMFPKQSKHVNFQRFWDSTLHDGVFEVPQTAGSTAFAGNLSAAAGKVSKPSSNSEDTFDISFFETVNMGSGQYANNPWLMEMPDPVTRCVWGNYLSIPVIWENGSNEFTAYKDLNAAEFYSEADKVAVSIGDRTENCTVIRQFGQMNGTVALALGYGREMTGRQGLALGEAVGVNVFPWMSIDENGNTQYYASGVSVGDRVGKDKEFACVQYHHTMGVQARDENGEMVKDEETGKDLNVDEKTTMTIGAGYQGGLVDRSVIYQSNVREIEEFVHHIEEKRHEAEHLNSKTLYPYDKYSEDFYSQGHHWALHIDMNACTGCGACQVACLAENNVPVVGKKEVHRHHEMTWLRIDRYYYGDYENPNVVYQPMMCQHCDNAPCENVCPVAATNHSSEGLNQMTYNRCIGTRYCANNCPYKVRRFNWLDYTTADLFGINEFSVNGEELPFGADNLTRMVLNPDVTVRSRGVIEKCSFCVQRIQQGKLTAKTEGRKLRDEDVKSACQTSCPTGAIVFGDLNNSEGELSKRLDNPLNYLVLEEINVLSTVYYQAKVNNRDEELDA